jgi:hypothetical protein
LSDFTATAEADTAADASADLRRRSWSVVRDDLSAVNLLLAALAIACILAALAGSMTN